MPHSAARRRSPRREAQPDGEEMNELRSRAESPDNEHAQSELPSQIVSFMTTEHYTLQMGCSITMTEIGGIALAIRDVRSRRLVAE
jgi:hypothetical protein